MSGLTTAGAIAGATEEVAKDAQPFVNQLVEQSYEAAYKQRTARSQAVLASLVAKPGDVGVIGDFESVLTGLCTDAGYIRAGGVQRCYSLTVSDLAIFADVLALCIKQAEQLATLAK